MRQFFTDSHGKVTIWQTPNIPLVVWFAATVASKLITHEWLHTGLEIIAFGFLFTWAWLEITTGLSYFRRVLGAVILLVIVWSRIA